MRSSQWAIIAALFITEVAAIFESTMIFVALPTLIREFGDPVTAGWLVTSHSLIGTSAALMAGRLGDIYGRKRIALIMLAVAAAGSVLSAVTSDYLLVLFGRSLQGLSFALIPLSIGIIRETLPRERVPVAVGLMTTAMGVGTATGLVLGGWLTDNFPWHALFVVSAILLAIAWVVVQILIPRTSGNPPRIPIDWIEGLLPIPAISSILLGISLSKSYGWLHPLVIGPLVLGLTIISYWTRRSLRAEEPFINLRLLAKRNVALANLLAIILSFGTMQITLVYSAYTQNPLWTAAGLGLTATVTGLAKLPSNLLSFFAGPLSGWLMQKRGMRLPILIGGILATIGWVISIGLPSTLAQVIILLCIISFGTTILNAAIPNVIVASVPENRTSEAIGGMSVIRGMSQSIGAQVIAVMLATRPVIAPENGAELPSRFGFQLTMGWIAALSILAALLAFLLRPRDEDEQLQRASSPRAAVANG